MNPLVAGVAGLTFAYIEYGKMPERIFWLLIFVSTVLTVAGFLKNKES